jgi:hypothetical protein
MGREVFWVDADIGIERAAVDQLLKQALAGFPTADT